MQRIDAQRLIYRNTLVCTPGLPVPATARHHSLNTHPRIEWAWREVRSRRRGYAGIQESSERHRAFHEVFSIEMKLVRVVIGVGGKQRRRHTQRLDTTHQVIVDQRAVGNLV